MNFSAEVTIGTRSMPTRPGQAAASVFSAGRSKAPSSAWTITALGMPFSRMRAVSARVSMPVMPTMPRAFSQVSRCFSERQLEGSVIEALSTMPRAPAAFAMSTVSTSSSLMPTLPMCGKVKVMIWPA